MLIKNQGRKTLQALCSLVPNYILFIKIKFLAIVFKSNCCLLFCFLERIYFNAPIPRHLQNWNSKLEAIRGSESFFVLYMICYHWISKSLTDIDILYRFALKHLSLIINLLHIYIAYPNRKTNMTHLIYI